jgi:6-phosphogluconolactonase
MHAAAEKIITLAAEAIGARGRFAWALAGGSTPRRLYSLLSSAPYTGRVDWDRVYFFWGDERCVPPDHPDSNYGMARDAFLTAVHPPPNNLHRMPGEAEPSTGAAIYEATLRQVFARTFGGPSPGGFPRFDLVLLGMGNDGHTASLFPGTPALGEAQRWVVSTHVEQPVPFRLTLTLPVLNAAANVLFLVAGADKAERVAEVLAPPVGLVDDEPSSLPSRRVRPARGQLTWLLDAPAASRLLT